MAYVNPFFFFRINVGRMLFTIIDIVREWGSWNLKCITLLCIAYIRLVKNMELELKVFSYTATYDSFFAIFHDWCSTIQCISCYPFPFAKFLLPISIFNIKHSQIAPRFDTDHHQPYRTARKGNHYAGKVISSTPIPHSLNSTRQPSHSAGNLLPTLPSCRFAW